MISSNGKLISITSSNWVGFHVPIVLDKTKIYEIEVSLRKLTESSDAKIGICPDLNFHGGSGHPHMYGMYYQGTTAYYNGKNASLESIKGSGKTAKIIIDFPAKSIKWFLDSTKKYEAKIDDPEKKYYFCAYLYYNKTEIELTRWDEM
mmetsp:Transcript_124375/g.175465  ORF Transcript_124375/g.175465 Transcript_124375/m.175465 type:complete len:148 (-) Transcript_124375:79-522(-)